MNGWTGYDIDSALSGLSTDAPSRCGLLDILWQKKKSAVDSAFMDNIFLAAAAGTDQAACTLDFDASLNPFASTLLRAAVSTSLSDLI